MSEMLRVMALRSCSVVFICLIVSAQIIRVSAAEDGKSTEEVPETPDSPYETQTAQCTITSGDIEASAQASISKTLVGVCGSDEMLEAFRTLETKMLEEMYNLRRMIRDPYFNPPPLRASVYKTIKRVETTSKLASNTSLPQVTKDNAPSRSTTTLERLTSTTTSPSVVFPDDDYDDAEENSDTMFSSKGGSVISNSDLVKDLSSTAARNESLASRIAVIDDRNPPQTSPAIDFKPIDKPLEKKFLTGGLRDYEVYRFNNTVISSGDAKVFKYFWKIEHFTKRVRGSPSMRATTNFSSAVFVISGLNLRLYASTATKANGDEALYVQLKQLSSSDDALRKTPNVVLASGTLYGQVETSTFFRHKIVILNQDQPFSDLISSDLTNTNAKFEAPLSTLTTEPYLKDDKLLVKVIIFL